MDNNTKEKKKSKMWLWVLLLALIVAIWIVTLFIILPYMNSHNADMELKENMSLMVERLDIGMNNMLIIMDNIVDYSNENENSTIVVYNNVYKGDIESAIKQLNTTEEYINHFKEMDKKFSIINTIEEEKFMAMAEEFLKAKDILLNSEGIAEDEYINNIMDIYIEYEGLKE